MCEAAVDPHDISFRPVAEGDYEFLYQVYASTREVEMAMTGWPPQQVEEFLRMQSHLQHTQYMQNYPGASFEIIRYRGSQIGRLYVHRRADEIRVIDIALLREFRRRGIGSHILGRIIEEADRRRVPVRLHVEANNPAMSMYERFGFRTREEVGVYLFMERPVSSP
jgi:ribosomal protein S18 acetylase RimI-like enzyme